MGIDPPTAAAARALIQASADLPAGESGILSIPLGFLGAWLGTLLGGRELTAEDKFTELEVRANTGLGSEKAVA